MKVLILDYETFSELDVTDVGAWEYSIHPSTRVLCTGFKYGPIEHIMNQPSRLVLPGVPCGENAMIKAALSDPEVLIVAHNALFDYLIHINTLKQKTDLNRWYCTAAQAAMAGLPRSLDGATSALGTVSRKDKAGQTLMKKLARQESDDIDDYMKLYDYCLHDIDATAELFVKTPKLPASERAFWLINQRINLRGFAIDRELVKRTLEHCEVETKRLDDSTKELTGGELDSTRQLPSVKKFLAKLGVHLPNMQAETITDSLQRDDLPELARAILEIRDLGRRVSTAKFLTLEERSRSDGRARDNLLFYGAHTGRDSGTGGNPQNLFKSVISEHEVEQAIRFILLDGSVGFMPWIFDKPLEVCASVMRSCIVPGPKQTFIVGDFSTIEVVVLFWAAEHKRGLAALEQGQPIYLDMASKIYKEPLQRLVELYAAADPATGKKRQLGKATVLGSGFGIGLGGERFQAAAKTLAGLDITIETAQLCVQTYRDDNPEIVRYWKDIEQCAKQAVRNPGVKVTMKQRKLVWQMIGHWLTVQLPTGRKLWYYKPILQRDKYGDKITYMHVDSTTKKFVRTSTFGGKLTENVVQAMARDLLYEALQRFDATRVFKPVLSVHDEIVCEVKDEGPDITEALCKQFTGIMSQRPKWAPDMPVKVEVWHGKRYKK